MQFHSHALHRLTLGAAALVAGLGLHACAAPASDAPEGDQATSGSAQPAEELTGPAVEITVLTTNAADFVDQGEWSFAAWIETEDRPILFDTGWSPRNVLENARALGIDLSRAEDLVLSHHHPDHTGGLVVLRTELARTNPKALSRIHVARGIFVPRPGEGDAERNPMIAARQQIEATGAEFIVYDEPSEIAPGVWITGPVPRTHNEKTYPRGPGNVLQTNSGVSPDDIPESQSLVALAQGGPILISGCGHAGLINTLEHTHAHITELPVQSALGGFHLFAADDETLDWTASEATRLGLGGFLGSHCTGIESVYHIRERAGMSRDTARVGAIGTRFVAGEGIIPGAINR